MVSSLQVIHVIKGTISDIIFGGFLRFLNISKRKLNHFSGSHYAVYQQGFDYNKEACIQVETASEMLNRTDLLSNDFILSYETDCAPPDSLLSIIILISCCALSRCGLWLFDLAVNQMFQEWVKPNQVKSYASQKDIKIAPQVLHLHFS